jgi:hypothetical protein
MDLATKQTAAAHLEPSLLSANRITMTDTVDALILDLLEYVACKERKYIEVIEAWHTSCPRLPVWEEANERGLIIRARANGHAVVRITAAGAELLGQWHRLPPY